VEVKLAHAEAAAKLAKEENQELQQQVLFDLRLPFCVVSLLLSSASAAETSSYSRELVQLRFEGRA
jgi:hypothetical protein